MKFFTTNSKLSYFLFFLAMMLGVWIPQGWAATIYSTSTSWNLDNKLK